MSRQPARNKDPESSVVSESLFTNVCLYCFFSLESGTWGIRYTYSRITPVPISSDLGLNQISTRVL